MSVSRIKVAVLPLDLPCSGLLTHSGEILTNDKSHNMKLGGLLQTAAEMKHMRKTAGEFGQIIQQTQGNKKKLNVTTVLYKIEEYRRHWLQQHALYWTAEDNKKLQTNRQKKPAETINKTSRSVRKEWANCMLAR